ncbi:Uncharacterised protein [Proteus vulgaris]|uniref:Uncharacterized protein n=1 Tax=Proteus vulgaris TaxID=585 RepID=A0A379F4C6_PROVU|nr:hypothetical protein [Proteus vulgaris]SUC14446.1 Uncharacterised protein [Proteus vulgaris]
MTDKNYDQYYKSDGSITSASLRDKFAMAAMNGILVNTERNQFSFSETGEIASKAYELADAMLKARG